MKWYKRTSRFITQPLPSHSLLLQINMVFRDLAGLVLDCEGEDGVSGFDGIFTLFVGGGEGGVDEVEGFSGGECVYIK